MYILQKPTAIKFPSVFFLILMAAWCQTAYSQKSNSPAAAPAPPNFNRCWEYRTDKLADYDFASDNAKGLYVVLLDGKLISLDSTSGEKRWETDLGGEVVSASVVDEGSVYAVRRFTNESRNEFSLSGSNLTLYSLNRLTGLNQWKIEFLINGSSSVEKVYLSEFENYLIVISDGGDVYAVDKNERRIIWTKKLPAKLSARPFIKSERVFLGTSDKRIVNLSLRDGGLIKEWKVSAPPTTVVEDTNGVNLVWGDRIGSLMSFNKNFLTPNWKFRNGAQISTVTFTRKGFLVASLDNFVYLISEANGKLLWKKRLAGRILDEPQVDNDHFIITTADDPFASVVELDTGKLVNRIALENDSFFAGESIRSGDRFVFATARGIVSFSDGGLGCASGNEG